MNVIQRAVVRVIEYYQATLSPDHGVFRHQHPAGFCRYTPSCSMYTKDAIVRHGTVIGSLLGLWRIIRCNPWSKGGYDPVPETLIR